jgi:hypothetical protein
MSGMGAAMFSIRFNFIGCWQVKDQETALAVRWAMLDINQHEATLHAPPVLSSGIRHSRNAEMPVTGAMHFATILSISSPHQKT